MPVFAFGGRDTGDSVHFWMALGPPGWRIPGQIHPVPLILRFDAGSPPC